MAARTSTASPPPGLIGNRSALLNRCVYRQKNCPPIKGRAQTSKAQTVHFSVPGSPGFRNTRMPFEEGMMEQDINSNPSRSILLAVSSTLTAISFALGEYSTTTVLYIAFTSCLLLSGYMISICRIPFVLSQKREKKAPAKERRQHHKKVHNGDKQKRRYHDLRKPVGQYSPPVNR